MWCICRAGPSLGPLILGYSFAFGAPGMRNGLGLNLYELHNLISLIFPHCSMLFLVPCPYLFALPRFWFFSFGSHVLFFLFPILYSYFLLIHPLFGHKIYFFLIIPPFPLINLPYILLVLSFCSPFLPIYTLLPFNKIPQLFPFIPKLSPNCTCLSIMDLIGYIRDYKETVSRNIYISIHLLDYHKKTSFTM